MEMVLGGVTNVVDLGAIDPFAFEQVAQDNRGVGNWQGTLDAALAATNGVIDSACLDGRLWYPVRALGGIIDHAPAEHKIELVNQGTRLAAELFAGVYDADRLAALHRSVGQAGIGGAIIRKPIDSVTNDCTVVDDVMTNAGGIHAELHGQAVLFLPVASGGIAGGIGAALAYARFTGANTLVYPFRLSLRKSRDHSPQLTEQEQAYIRAIAGDKPVVVYDSDIDSGATMDAAVTYLRRLLPDNLILGTATIDNRDDEAKENDGLWFEHVGHDV